MMTEKNMLAIRMCHHLALQTDIPIIDQLVQIMQDSTAPPIVLLDSLFFNNCFTLATRYVLHCSFTSPYRQNTVEHKEIVFYTN